MTVGTNSCMKATRNTLAYRQAELGIVSVEVKVDLSKMREGWTPEDVESARFVLEQTLYAFCDNAKRYVRNEFDDAFLSENP